MNMENNIKDGRIEEIVDTMLKQRMLIRKIREKTTDEETLQRLDELLRLVEKMLAIA